jgi:hypothetical protein
MKRINRSFDNGAVAGLSGWGGGLLAALVESDFVTEKRGQHAGCTSRTN